MWVWNIEYWIGLALFAGAAVMEAFALCDAILRPAHSYAVTDKLSKPAWVLILLLALLTCIAFRSPVSLFGLLGVVASGVYLADARPALREVRRR
ncbi:MAG TPA: DUF2516 family protein [Marmoricola sp.]